jgi:transcriptional regulator GlxA family with amidase domain
MLAAGKEAVEDWFGPVSQLSLQELRRADAFMSAHAHEPISIGDVAQHLGISVRKLQYTFRRHRDTTPLAVLRRFRLEGVRRDLGTPEAGSIAEVALRWGFTNLGRFSRQYRGEFQEKPSQTLAKARQRRHPE